MTYFPILKTRDSELRGVHWLADHVKRSIMPLFELTKSRKTKNNPDGPVIKRIETIARDYGNDTFILDPTSFTDLKNKEISAFYHNNGGFNNWLAFLKQQSKHFNFVNLHPTLLVSDENLSTEEEYIKVHRDEFYELQQIFPGKVVYRVPLEYEGLQFDLENFFDAKKQPPIIILDMGYVRKGRASDYANAVKKKLMLINDKQYNIQQVILAGSSFPKDPSEGDMCNDKCGEHPLEEKEVHRICTRGNYSTLLYGDYATIYPLPNEQAGGNGWIPRIDFPTVRDSIKYHRHRRKLEEKNYATAYQNAAKSVVNDQDFGQLEKIIGRNCWGVEQIYNAANGYPAGLSPSFWISVRINLHITLQSILSR